MSHLRLGGLRRYIPYVGVVSDDIEAICNRGLILDIISASSRSGFLLRNVGERFDKTLAELKG